MAAVRPIVWEPRSAMDIEQLKLFRLSVQPRRDDAFSTRTRQYLAAGYAGTQVGGQTRVSGGVVG